MVRRKTVAMYAVSRVKVFALAYVLLCENLVPAHLQCSAQNQAEISVNIISQRNGSGQWVSQVGLERGCDHSDSSKWSLGVKYGTTKYDDVQLVRTITLSVSSTPQRVGPDYGFYPGVGYYKFHPVATTWPRARQICEEEGGHLAVIGSLKEVETMQEIFTWFPRDKNIGSTDADHAWVGFQDISIEGKFVTIFGEPFNTPGVLKWTSGNPDVSSGVEDCGGYHRSLPAGVVDAPCDWKLSFICEQELW